MSFSRFLPLLTVAALAVAFAWRLTQLGEYEDMATYHDPMLGKPMPALALPRLDNGGLLRTKELEGQPYLLNVFASWCLACRIEHLPLKYLAESQELPLYGIAWKDRPDNTRNWLRQMGNIYEDIGVDRDGKAALELGLTGTPETYLVSSEGTIVALYRGALSEAVVESRFLPAVRELETEPQEVQVP